MSATPIDSSSRPDRRSRPRARSRPAVGRVVDARRRPRGVDRQRRRVRRRLGHLLRQRRRRRARGRKAGPACPRPCRVHRDQAGREPLPRSCGARPASGPQAGLMHPHVRHAFESPDYEGWWIGEKPIVSAPCRCDRPTYVRDVALGIQCAKCGRRRGARPVGQVEADAGY
jgi:hypothetical protein